MQFVLVQHAGLGAGIDHGGDILGGDLVDWLGGNAEQLERGIGRCIEHPDHGLEQLEQRQHRADHLHRAGLREGHGDAFGDQVRELDEQQRDDQERADIGDALCRAGIEVRSRNP
jgi:hypothetical protein